MKPHVFVDESKNRGYLLAAAVIKSCDVAKIRKPVAGLRLPSQRRVHFTAESDTRRKTILGVLAGLVPGSVTIYNAVGYRDPKLARDAAMAALVDDAAKMGAERLIIEQDDQARSSDEEIIREQCMRAGCYGLLRYEHRRAYEEPLLAIHDAVAWSWAKGQLWRSRVAALVQNVVEV